MQGTLKEKLRMVKDEMNYSVSLEVHICILGNITMHGVGYLLGVSFI